MAANDVTVFNEAKVNMIAGDWSSTDSFKISLHTGALPTAADLTPSYDDYSGSEAGVGSGGTPYATGGDTLTENLAALVTQTGGVLKFDSADAPTWTDSTSSAVTYAIIYNDTNATNDAVCFIELGTVDMTAGSLTINFHASGIFTIT